MLKEYTYNKDGDLTIIERKTVQKFKKANDTWFSEEIISIPVYKNQTMDALLDDIEDVVENHDASILNSVSALGANNDYKINISVYKKVEDDETIKELEHELYQSKMNEAELGKYNNYIDDSFPRW